MLRTILLSTLRQARRHPFYVGLNVFGLALGLCVFLLLGQFVRHEYAYNTGISDSDLITRIDDTVSFPGRAPFETGNMSFYALPFLREDFPYLASSTMIRPDGDVLVEANGKRLTRDVDMVDSSFLKTIPLSLSKGDPHTALDRPDGMILSTRLAIDLFGSVDVLGRTVLMDDAGDKVTSTVTGILAPPATPQTIDPDVLMPVPAYARKSTTFSRWGSEGGSVYLRFHDTSERDRTSAQMQDFLIRRAAGPNDDDRALGPHPERTNHLRLVTLRQLRFHDMRVEFQTDGTDRTVIDSLSLIGILTLVLALANAVNLATARGALRAREIAMRKTLGASRPQLFIQFLGESLLMTSIAGLAALSLRELLLPVMTAVTGTRLGRDYGETFGVLIAAVLVSGFAAGVYPAFVLSAYRPAAILAASRLPSGGRSATRIRNILVLAQFVLAALITICTLVVNRQAEFVRTADTGFERQGLLISPQIAADDAGTQHRILDALRAVPGVEAATLSELEPDIATQNNFTVSLPNGPPVQVLSDRITDQYQDVYHPRMLSGRWFDRAHGVDRAAQADSPQEQPRLYNVIVNATLVHALGLKSPADAVGTRLKTDGKQMQIIGVEDDVRFVSPHQQIAPLVIVMTEHVLYAPVATIRFSGATAKLMQERLRHVWDSMVPDVDGDFVTASDRTSGFYEADQRQAYLFLAGSAVAIVIACLGLWGLATFAGARRRQEVGIRKALGASTAQVVALMLREFLTPVLIACAIACPLAWAAMRAWLATFVQRIALSPFDFLFVVAGATLIAALTVVGQTLRVARSEPARALWAE